MRNQNQKWREQYDQMGYAIAQPNFGDRLLTQALDDIQRILRKKRNRLGKNDHRTRETENEIHLKSEAVKRIISSDWFATVSQSLLGSSVDLRMCFTLTKTMEHGGPIPWHQDWGLDKDSGHPRFSFWIPLRDTSISNGCLRVIPESHLEELYPHSKTVSYPNDLGIESVNEAKAIALEMKAGEVLLIHPKLIHGSGSCQSKDPRVVILGSYQVPKVRYSEFWANAGVRFLQDGQINWEPIKFDPSAQEKE
jgi:non-heme Fe2+,alpha-ketoglutarate-dependent halogenase